AFPWPARACLSTGMRQLHSGDAALVVNELNDPLQWGNVIIAPDAEVVRTDAAFRDDCCRFSHDQTRPTHCTTAQMHKVPVVREPIRAGVLTHRRDKNTIGEFQVTDCERIEKMSHANTFP